MDARKSANLDKTNKKRQPEMFTSIRLGGASRKTFNHWRRYGHDCGTTPQIAINLRS